MTKIKELEDSLKIRFSSNEYRLDDNSEIIELRLPRFNIKEINILSQLLSLQWLYLDYNKIEDLSPLISLSRLKTLCLNFNNIIDISPLRDLNNLCLLNLSGNNIRSLEPLENLKNLRWLDISYNNISNISSLLKLNISFFVFEKCPYLGKEPLINLYNNPISVNIQEGIKINKSSICKYLHDDHYDSIEKINGIYNSANTRKSIIFFVLMPFDVKFDSVYETIKTMIEKNLKFRCLRADEIFGTEPIVDDIMKQIKESNYIIADLTGRNPNVFYELGVAHSLKKKTILLTQNEGDVPFDVKHIRYIKYEDSIQGAKTLCDNLRKTIKNII